MIRVLIFLLILVAGLILGPMIAGNQGVVTINLADYDIEMSVTVFIMLIIIIFCVILFVLYLLRKLFHLKNKSGEWLNKRTINKLERTQKLAQTKMLEGDYLKAEKLLVNSAKTTKNPTLQYLQAANAALQANELDHAEMLLKKAKLSCSNKERFTLEIMETQLYLKQGKFKEANIYIDSLLEQKPKHPEVLRLAEKYCELSHDIAKHLTLLPQFKKAGLYSETEFEQMRDQLYLQLIDKNSQLSDIELTSWWHSQPRAVRNNTRYQNHYIEQLVTLGNSQLAFKHLYVRLKKAFDADLVALIPKLNLAEPEQLDKLLKRLDQQIPSLSSADKTALYRSYAQLNANNKNWFAARDAIKKVIQLEPTLEDYQLQETIENEIDHIPILEDKTESERNV